MSQIFKITHKMFLNENRLRNAQSKFAGKWLNKAGAFIRTAATRSMKKGKKNQVSPPGTPPYYHTSLLRDNILFATTISKAVVNVGPKFLVQYGTAFGAELLEFGGHTMTWQGIRIFKPRPYMGPALIRATKDLQRKHADEIPKAWRAAVSGEQSAQSFRSSLGG
jgi:hypothetical protein